MNKDSVKVITNPAKILLDEHHEWVNTACPASKKQVNIQLCTPLKPKGTRIICAPLNCDYQEKCTSKKLASCLLKCQKLAGRRQK